jgi:epoxide hydrolase 4
MYCVESIERKGKLAHFLHIEAAQAQSPLVILLHGFPDNAFGWDLQIETLRSTHHIIAPFVRGSLNDEKVDLSEVTLEALKENLSLMIKKVKRPGQKIYVIDHDLGAFLSTALLEEEWQIDGVIHINGLGMQQFVSRKLSLSQWQRSSYVLLAQLAWVRALVSKIFPRRFLKLIYNLSKLSADDSLRDHHSRVLASIGIYRNLLREALGSLGKKVKRIETPTLFIWGKNDAFLNLPTTQEVTRFYEKGTIRILQGGHWVLRSHAQEVNRLILKTLKGWEERHE